MTDRFVPDKPGYYWHKVQGRVAIAKRAHNDDIWTIGNKNPFRNRDMRWIAPVTPPDVVDGLVAALEAVLNQNDDRYDKVSVALQRYRGG